MDYETLTNTKATAGSLADWANDSRLQADSSFIVQEAESYIYRSLRHWRMLSVPTAGNFVVGQDYIAIPSDFLEPFMLVLTGIYQMDLSQQTVEQVINAWSYDSNGDRIEQQPRIYSFNGTNLIFDSEADQTYAYALIYFQQPAALSTLSSPGTNWVTTFYPKLMRAACMMQVAEWQKDSGTGQTDTRMYWGQVAERELTRAQQESDRARRGITFHAQIVGGGPRDIMPTYI